MFVPQKSNTGKRGVKNAFSIFHFIKYISDDIYPKKLNSASFHTVITYFDSSLFHFSWVELLLLNTFRWAAKSGRVVVTFIKAKIYMQ